MNMRLLLYILNLAVSIAVITNTANAQIIADPITPSKIPMHEDLGVFAGIGGNIQNGTFYSSCPCDFIDGRGLSFFAGILYEREVFYSFRLGLDALYKSDKLASSYRENELVTARSSISGKEEKVKVSSRHTGNFNISYFSFQPYLKFYIIEPFYIKLSFSATLPLSTNITHTQELLQKTALLSTGEIGNIYMTDKNGNIIESNIAELQNEEYPQVNSFQLGLVPTIGFDIALNKKMCLSPSFQFHIPLSKISQYTNPPDYSTGADPVGFSITSWYFRLEYRHTLLSDEVLKHIP
jgi:hypothetical protein